jgi:hypothetical protein
MGWEMKQLTLATAGFERYAKTTRRAAFLAEIMPALSTRFAGSVRDRATSTSAWR